MLKIPARFKQCDLSISLAFDYCDCIVNMGTRAAACKQFLYLTFHENVLYVYFSPISISDCSHSSPIVNHIFPFSKPIRGGACDLSKNKQRHDQLFCGLNPVIKNQCTLEQINVYFCCSYRTCCCHCCLLYIFFVSVSVKVLACTCVFAYYYFVCVCM